MVYTNLYCKAEGGFSGVWGRKKAVEPVTIKAYPTLVLIKMGEGVSLSLPREGAPAAILLPAFSSLISVPFTREHVSLCERNFSGGLNLPDNQ